MTTYSDWDQRQLDIASGEELDRAARRTVIVPNYVHDAIQSKLDAALAEVPDAAPDRDIFYQTLLNYFDEHGVLPEFSLVKRERPQDGDDQADGIPSIK